MSASDLLLVDAALAGPLGRSALIVAQAELGTMEVPKGSNRGPRVEVYQRGFDGADYLVGQRWCARFARWCFETAARQLGVPSPFFGWKSDLGSALKWREQAQLRRCWAPDPAPGRVGVHLVEDPNNKAMHGHVVLVAHVDGDWVTSVAGNEDDQVAICRRPRSYYAGFVELG